jgi:hypothetical protein
MISRLFYYSFPRGFFFFIQLTTIRGDIGPKVVPGRIVFVFPANVLPGIGGLRVGIKLEREQLAAPAIAATLLSLWRQLLPQFHLPPRNQATRSPLLDNHCAADFARRFDKTLQLPPQAFYDRFHPLAIRAAHNSSSTARPKPSRFQSEFR